MAIYREKTTLGAVEARPGDLNLNPEVMSLPRRAGCLAMKPFDGPGEPDASLGELGSRKIHKMTLLPPSLVSFCILDQNTE